MALQTVASTANSQTYIVDNEGAVVMYRKKVYRVSGMNMKLNPVTTDIQVEYKLIPVGHGGNIIDPLWVQEKSVTFLRS